MSQEGKPSVAVEFESMSVAWLGDFQRFKAITLFPSRRMTNAYLIDVVGVARYLNMHAPLAHVSLTGADIEVRKIGKVSSVRIFVEVHATN
jgi:hypothetical protein